MAKTQKLTESEMAFIIDRLETFGPGASVRDKMWSIWVKGSGAKWIYHDAAGTYLVVSAEELLRTYGFAGVRTDGFEKTPNAMTRTAAMTDAYIQDASNVALDRLDVGGTVVGQDGTLWVKTGGWEWVHITEDGGFIAVTREELIEEYGPLVARSDGKIQLRISAY